MICAVCSTKIWQTNGWMRFSRERELYLGDHSEITTEVEVVVCSWDCLLSAARTLPLSSLSKE